MNILLRNTTSRDFANVREILRETWLDTYSSFIPKEDLLYYLEKTYNDDNLLQMINDNLNHMIIAEANENPAGWMRLSENLLQKRFYVSSLYVLPSYQGYGIGKKMFEYAEMFALKKTYDKIWLGVMMDNVRTYEWYCKTGFNFIEEEPFRMGKSDVLHLIGYKFIK